MTVVDPDTIIARGHCVMSQWILLLHPVRDLEDLELVHHVCVVYCCVLHVCIITRSNTLVNLRVNQVYSDPCGPTCAVQKRIAVRGSTVSKCVIKFKSAHVKQQTGVVQISEPSDSHERLGSCPGHYPGAQQHRGSIPCDLSSLLLRVHFGYQSTRPKAMAL